MYDTSDRTVTSYICPSTPHLTFGLYCSFTVEIRRTLIPIMSDIVSINNKITINILNVMFDFDM